MESSFEVRLKDTDEHLRLGLPCFIPCGGIKKRIAAEMPQIGYRKTLCARNKPRHKWWQRCFEDLVGLREHCARVVVDGAAAVSTVNMEAHDGAVGGEHGRALLHPWGRAVDDMVKATRP